MFDLAAAPPGAEPLNIEPFRAFLRDQLDAKAVAAGKLLGDIRAGGKQLRLASRAGRRGRRGFEARWPSVRASVVQSITDGLGFDDAVCRIGDFVTALSVETGGRFGAQLRDEFSYPRIEEELAAALDESGLKPSPRVRAKPGRDRSAQLLVRGRGPRRIRRRCRRLPASWRNASGRGLFEMLWERGVLGATLAQVEIEARLAENR